VTVGETLTEARYRAGLSVDELSERTRIRGTVIRSIEQDDYEACGGDLYVHGYVRAIAGAVGIDAQPLIREYDLGRPDGQNTRPNGSTGWYARGYPNAAPDTAQTSFDLSSVTEDPAGHDVPASAVGLDATRYDMPAVREDPAATSFDLPRVPEDLPAALEDLMAAGYDLTPAAEPVEAESPTLIIPALGPGPADRRATAAWSVPGQGDPMQASPVQGGPVQGGPVQAGSVRTRTARKKRRGFFAVAAAVVVVAGGALGIHLATQSTTIKNAAATTVPRPSAAAAAKGSAAAQASASAAAKASATAQASASGASQAAAGAQPVVSLPVVTAMAFGPSGFADGDNPGRAKDAIARDPSQPWSTQWYDTATFGMLKHGTGLLLDLGGKVTVTGVRLDLSKYLGTDLQLRVGNGTAAQDLQLAATANNVGGVVKLTLRHPVAARYLLIWFTQLPPNSSGQYQETVSHVAVTGRH
jgi:Helix-turn-helix domain